MLCYFSCYFPVQSGNKLLRCLFAQSQSVSRMHNKNGSNVLSKLKKSFKKDKEKKTSGTLDLIYHISKCCLSLHNARLASSPVRLSRPHYTTSYQLRCPLQWLRLVWSHPVFQRGTPDLGGQPRGPAHPVRGLISPTGAPQIPNGHTRNSERPHVFSQGSSNSQRLDSISRLCRGLRHVCLGVGRQLDLR